MTGQDVCVCVRVLTDVVGVENNGQECVKLKQKKEKSEWKHNNQKKKKKHTACMCD